MAAFEIYVDQAGGWRWRLRANNGEVIAVSEGYEKRTGAEHGIHAVRVLAADAEIKVLETGE